MRIQTILLLITSFLVVSEVASQCNQFYQFKDGSRWELETYNKKGVKTGTVKHFIKEYTPSGSGYKATVNMAVTNKKGKQTQNGDFAMRCENGVTYFDMEQFIPEESLKAFGNMKLSIVGDDLEWPKDLSVGLSLKDGHIQIKGDQGFPLNLKMDMTDRKVVGKEKITTPAGTFDCYKITYRVKIKTIVSVEFNVAQWIAEGVGGVRSENYNKNGKMTGYSILSKLEM